MSNVSLIDGHIDEMTDNEIIKALENEVRLTEYIDSNYCDDIDLSLIKYAIKLINRQQAELERLEKVLNGRDQIVNALNKCYKQAKTEAIKEFWGKLKKHSRKMQSSDFSGEFWDRAVLVEDGDNLLKEMVAE